MEHQTTGIDKTRNKPQASKAGKGKHDKRVEGDDHPEQGVEIADHSVNNHCTLHDEEEADVE